MLPKRSTEMQFINIPRMLIDYKLAFLKTINLLFSKESSKLLLMSHLQEFPFESHYQDVSGCRMHYLDEGEKEAPALIFLHGVLPVPGMKTPHLFRIWRLFAQISPLLPVGRIIDFGSKKRLSSMERRGYDFPFNSSREKKAIKV